MTAKRAPLGDAIDDPLAGHELGDGLLERRERPDAQLAAGANTVARAVIAVAQARHLRAEHLGEVLVLGEIREDPLWRLGEVVLDMNPLRAHGRQPTRPPPQADG